MSSESLEQQIMQAVADTPNMYYRLLLIVASPGNGKTAALLSIAKQMGAEYVNLNMELSKRLLSLTERQRTLYVGRVIDDIVDPGTDPVLLDNIELLFDPDLRQEPLRLLQEWSRRRTMVAVWPGALEDGYLTYAEPGHREYKRYPARDLIIVEAGSG